MGASGLVFVPAEVSYVKEEITIEERIGNPVLVEIAKCESGLRHYVNGKVIRGELNNADVGIMQINETYHKSRAVSLGLDLEKLDDNIKFARLLYEEQGVRPWFWSKSCWSSKVV